MKTISRYIMTLALLITAATGAWAQTTVTWTEADLTGSGSDLTTYTKDGVTIKCDTRLSSGKSFNGPVTISTTLGNFTKIEITGLGSAPIQSDIFTNDGNVSTWTGNAASLNFPDAIAYATQFVFTIAPSGPEVTITGTSAEGQQAEFDMPQYDVTATYTLKRDISVDVAGEMADRIRIKKDGNDYQAVDATQMNPVVIDNLETNSPVTLTVTTDYTLQLQKQSETNADEWTDVTALSVGTFRYKITGAGNYSGICYSEEFALFQGYEVTVGAGEYATFYKDENLYTEDENAELYTIASVTDTEAVLSDAITVAPAETPLLVYNKSEQDKTFLLIPTTDKTPDNVTAATQFVGTLEATTIPASATGADNYALNGYAFVWVKTAIEVGANKCWLHIASQPAAARAMTRSIVGGNGTTNMDDVRWQMEDGNYYDLQGRKVEKPNRKGIYIHNGKKVIVR